MTYGTNDAFLSHFGLDALTDLPGLDELKGSGLIDGTVPSDVLAKVQQITNVQQVKPLRFCRLHLRVAIVMPAKTSA